MAKKKSPKGKKFYQPKLNPNRYQKYHVALLEGMQAGSKDHRAFWDFGPGERPQQVLTDFRYVARREEVAVVIDLARDGQSLVFIYPKPRSGISGVRVLNSEGQVKAEVPIDSGEKDTLPDSSIKTQES